ncbi:glycerol-3-phosphate acyltransferase [Planomicrobium sp. CPCC 101110]|uniref:glycerol-3-phosphate acyltransferase n=1 Tax=Planomicrobium sp. CPCC 101110 TaxID=2599619 RepID=UPI0011B7047F|nr:glycerol-3-phosphate acyltransferase [Planomicrobium sp. CPCC 101110]TWT27530.1 glycerol-3-phosphate acyltransferase [Planomicrobium sp. CPCC 101110]
MILWIAIALITGYFIGCLHGSLAAQFLSGINIKKEGVKNSGASNAAIVLGWKYGALVAFLDIAKGFAAVAGLRMLLEGISLPNEMVWTMLFVAGAGVVFGHNFPFYMNFDGGKGTAAVIGVMLALDWELGLAGGLLLVAAALTTGYLVIGVLLLYGMFMAIALWPAESVWPIVTALLLFAMAVWKHLENIARIRNGTETKVSSVFKKKTAGSN